MSTDSRSGYLLAGQESELQRLQLQSRVWEPAGRALLDRLGSGDGLRTVDVGCGCFGWLRILSHWVGPQGSVTGTDVDDKLLDAARTLIEAESLLNVVLVHDDLFNSRLEPHVFDLVHSRFEIAPLGREEEQLESYLRLAAPGGWLVLEDPDIGSWHFNPPAPAAERLIALLTQAFVAAGGDVDAGRREFELLRACGSGPGRAGGGVRAAPGSSLPAPPSAVQRVPRTQAARARLPGRARGTAAAS